MTEVNLPQQDTGEIEVEVLPEPDEFETGEICPSDAYAEGTEAKE